MYFLRKVYKQYLLELFLLATFNFLKRSFPSKTVGSGTTSHWPVKFIDAKQDLSVQVHPSDDYALQNENQYGKTEAWYILDCDDDAGYGGGGDS